MLADRILKIAYRGMEVTVGGVELVVKHLAL